MEEKEFVDRCFQGDVEGFRMMVETYRDKLMALAVNILRNQEDAEDACQDAFLHAFKNIHRFDRQQSFKKWLLTILYRRCQDQLRRRKRWLRFLSKENKNREKLSAHSVKNGSFQKGEENVIPQKVLESLRFKEKAAVILWAMNGYTSEEIAEILGCRPSTARVYLFQARKKIKALLEKYDV